MFKTVGLRIAVDLTQMLPGGENGGSKVMVIELLKQLSHLAPQHHFILLTIHRANEELSILDKDNIERICILNKSSKPILFCNYLKKIAYSISKRIFPGYSFLFHNNGINKLDMLRTIKADLLFCPFTEQIFFDPRVPTVTLVHDLQYLYYPQFFDPTQITYREKFFRDACRASSKIICVSHFVRSTVLEKCDLIDSNDVKTIHTMVHHRIKSKFSNNEKEVFLSKNNLTSDRFLFYPANFWLHKNHETLFKAFKLYKDKYPFSDLKLVCTGTGKVRLNILKNLVEDLGILNNIIFAGYVNDDELSVFYTECKALIFPSLYEGFGMPVLEAMALGKCVLCSNVTSLPEIAGDAALFFDPNNPSEIAESISRIEKDPGLFQGLIVKGHNRVSIFGDKYQMAKDYLKVFEDAVCSGVKLKSFLHGRYPDGWAGDKICISIEPGKASREMMIEIMAPDFLPYKTMQINLSDEITGQSKNYSLERGSDLTIRHALNQIGGNINVSSSKVFQPKYYGMGDDERSLAYIIKSCFIVSSADDNNLISNRLSLL